MTANPINLACQNNIEKHAQNPINHNPNAFTTKKKPKKSKECITSSMPFSIDYLTVRQSLFEGEMTHLSFDCPKNLRTALNQAVRENGTSVCKILTEYSAAYIDATMVKKHALANTNLAPKKSETVVNVGIGELSFTQNVQNRPRRLVSCNVDATVNDAERDNRCMIGSCDKVAVEVMTFQPKGQEAKDYQVCSFHFDAYADYKDWRAKR